jgi:hypothetical protein
MASIDVIYLRHVREDSFAHQFASRHMQPTGYSEDSTAMELSAFASEQDYLARYTKVQRRRRKKIANAIEKLGPFSFTSHTRVRTFETCWTTSSVTSRAGSPNGACIPRR